MFEFKIKTHVFSCCCDCHPTNYGLIMGIFHTPGLSAEICKMMGFDFKHISCLNILNPIPAFPQNEHKDRKNAIWESFGLFFFINLWDLIPFLSNTLLKQCQFHASHTWLYRWRLFFFSRMVKLLFGITQGKIPDSCCPVAPASIMAGHAEPRFPLTL